MTTNNTARLLAFAALSLTAAVALTGCQNPATGASQQADCQSPSAVVLVVAAHANASPGIPAEAMCLVDKAIESQKPVSIIREDGDPSVLLSRRVHDVEPGSANYREDLKKARNSVITTIARIEAQAGGDDTLAALALAGDLTSSTPDAMVIMLSPGLSDQPPLDLTVPALATASAAEIANQIEVAGYAPRLDERTIMWFGLASAAGDQKQLPQPQRDNYQAIYSAILTNAGASATFYPYAANGNSAANNAGHTIRPVEPVLPDAITPEVDSTQVFNNASVFGFLPDSTEFRDPTAAAEGAMEIAQWLKVDPGRRLTITGTTASAGTPDARTQLSLKRARAVITAIGAAGADTSDLAAVGAGNVFEGVVQDIINGVLDPVKAEANRSVRITYQN